MSENTAENRLGVDIGGTFVDAVVFDPENGDISIEKASTTPSDPTRGVLSSIDKAEIDLRGTDRFVHGTTLGLNAVLERQGATTGIITNEGFRDVFEIGRYDRPADEMYTTPYRRPDTLVPRKRRLGVPCRLDADGEVVEPLDEAAVREATRRLVDEHGVDAIAVCFLHSYVNPEHERRAKAVVEDAAPDVSVSVSSDITGEYREYERTGTTVLDAYIKPTFESYVDRLEERLDERGFSGTLFVTRSGGGAMAAHNAETRPVHTVLSGPAGGLIGASHVADATGRENLITADMGGTSLDTCVVQDGVPSVEYDSSFEHLPLMVPVYDIRTIGAGGGSIAWVDDGLLKVGPRSAGSDPGPVCYDQGGTEPTITDAAVVLGYLDPDRFLGGEMTLDAAKAEAGVAETVAEPLDMSVEEASRGVFEVALAGTVSQIREITVEKGLDPREFSMLAFGGAGPMFVPLVAREMAVSEVLIPRAPAVFSAWGMLMADVVYDYSQTDIRLVRDTSFGDLAEAFESLEAEATETLRSEGFSEESIRLERSVEMRYFGQEHTVDVPVTDVDGLEAVVERFESEYRDRYGHTMDDHPEVVHQRVRGTGLTGDPDVGQGADPGGETASSDSRTAYCFARGEMTDFDVYRRSELATGEDVPGPAIVREPTTTIVFYSDQHASVDEHGHLVVREGSA
jgi:N-methylhydantoinase A